MLIMIIVIVILVLCFALALRIPGAPRKTWGIRPFADANRDASTVKPRVKSLDSTGFGPIRFLI